MEYATRKGDRSKEIVFATDYIDDTDIDVYDFMCPHEGCELELRLTSYKSTNLKAAYFGMRYKGTDHGIGCPIPKQKNRTTNTNGIDESIPFPFKSKLVLREYLGKHKGKPRCPDYKTGKHNNLANILATIVRWYIANPYQGKAPLDVPNCDYTDYQNVFHRITGDPSKNYSGWHIYYGQLLCNKDRAFEKTENHLVFKIYQADNAKPVEVKVDRHLLSSIGEKFIEKLYSDTEDKRVKGDKTWIFFLGRPVVPGSREFFFERYECVYFHSFEKLYLDSKYHYYVEPEDELVSMIQPVHKERDTVIQPCYVEVEQVQDDLYKKVSAVKIQNKDKSYEQAVENTISHVNTDLSGFVTASTDVLNTKKSEGFLKKILSFFLGR